MSSRPRFTYQGKSMSPFRRLIALPWKCWSAQRGDQRAGRISMNDDSREPLRICPVSSALYCTSSKNIKLLFHPGSRQDTSSRDDIQTVLPWLVPSRLSDILMRWDLAGSQCKCHSVSLTLVSDPLAPFHLLFLRPPFFSFSLSYPRREPPPPLCTPATQILVIAKLQFVLIRMLQNRI